MCMYVAKKLLFIIMMLLLLHTRSASSIVMKLFSFGKLLQMNRLFRLAITHEKKRLRTLHLSLVHVSQLKVLRAANRQPNLANEITKL